MADPRVLVQRWAQRWSGDPERLVEELYAPEAVSCDLTRPGTPVRTRDEVVADERRFAIRVPDRRLAVVGSLTDGTGRVVVEHVITGRGASDVVRMVAPGLRWWELDQAGRVVREWSWSRWEGRQPDDTPTDRPPAGRQPDDTPTDRPAADRPPADRLPAAPGPPAAGSRSQAWYRAFANRLAETRSWDPALSVAALYAPRATLEWPGSTRPAARGWSEIEAAEQALGSPAGGGGADTVVEAVVGEGPVLAVRLRFVARCPGTGTGSGSGELDERWVALLTLDDSDRIVSDRRYGPDNRWSGGPAGPGRALS